MMWQAPVASELLNELVCQCDDDCDSLCRCEMNGQPCTAACDCGGKTYDQPDRACINPVTMTIDDM